MISQIDQYIETRQNMMKVHKELFTVTNGAKFLNSITLGSEIKDEYTTDEDYLSDADTDIED